MQHQIQQNRVQPREISPPRGAQIRVVQGKVEEEIRDFLQAVNSYPARVAKEPRVSFQQHLSSIFAARRHEPNRLDSGSRRQ